MLSTLRIQNLVLIDALTLELAPGLNIFTGETGAGKSIVLNALSLVLGERASVELIRAGQESARVEAQFEVAGDDRVSALLAASGIELPDGVVVVCRELSREGKNRCYVNGRLVPLSLLKDVGDLLVDLHGQHEHQRLLDPAHHLGIIDAFGSARFQELKARVQRDLARLAVVRREQRALGEREAHRLAERELASLQLAEIRQARIDPSRDAQAEARLKLLANLERIRREAAEVACGLAGDDPERPAALATVQGLLPRLEWLAEASGQESLARAAGTAREATYLLDDVVQTLHRTLDRLDLDESEMADVQARCDMLAALRRKHGPSLADVVATGERLAARLEELASADEGRSRLVREEGEILSRAAGDVARLARQRREICRALEARVTAQLKDLAMEQARFKVELTRDEDPESPLALDGVRVHLYPDGVDRAELFIAPNPGEPLRPLARIASGGELSRVMLALKSSLAVLERVPIMVFDEIDAGIGGTTAVRVAGKLGQVSRYCQSLAITHLPQIAAAGTCHYAVEKLFEGGRTRTRVRRLDHDERVVEIQRMLGGPGAASLDHARRLLKEKVGANPAAAAVAAAASGRAARSTAAARGRSRGPIGR
jgi:DNA repair protein RecN (Recombination protein N)